MPPEQCSTVVPMTVQLFVSIPNAHKHSKHIKHSVLPAWRSMLSRSRTIKYASTHFTVCPIMRASRSIALLPFMHLLHFRTRLGQIGAIKLIIPPGIAVLASFDGKDIKNAFERQCRCGLAKHTRNPSTRRSQRVRFVKRGRVWLILPVAINNWPSIDQWNSGECVWGSLCIFVRSLSAFCAICWCVGALSASGVCQFATGVNRQNWSNNVRFATTISVWYAWYILYSICSMCMYVHSFWHHK